MNDIKHIVKKMNGYSDPDGKYLYECSCGEIISAWYLKDAQKEHRQQIPKDVKKEKRDFTE